MLCVFDCETVPDYALIQKTFELPQGLSEYESLVHAQKMHEDKTGTTFLPLPYHRVVALSAVIADDYGKFLKVGDFGKEDDSEEAIISHFFEFIEKDNPKLVSFNGRSFDMPMLLIRAMKYDLSLHAFFDNSNPQIGKTKWDNYRQRYSEGFHTDLMDSLSQFGAARGLKLDTLCSMMDIPGKYDVSGDQVMELFYEEKIEKIKEYCQSDVLNTYWLFLKYQMLRGDLTKEHYLDCLASIKLDPKMGYYEVFSKAISKLIDN
ncbi:MAG: 3'-5' exonuclease [Campylobacterota bacterium]